MTLSYLDRNAFKPFRAVHGSRAGNTEVSGVSVSVFSWVRSRGFLIFFFSLSLKLENERSHFLWSPTNDLAFAINGRRQGVPFEEEKGHRWLW